MKCLNCNNEMYFVDTEYPVSYWFCDECNLNLSEDSVKYIDKLKLVEKALRTRAKEYHDYLADCNDGYCESTDMIYAGWLAEAEEELKNE